MVAITAIMPYKTRSGKSPKKAASVSVISKAPLIKKRLRNLSKIKEEEEEENVSLIRKKKGVDGSIPKKAIENYLKIAQLLEFVILD